MVLAEGARVRYLKRISIGGLRLDEDLASGEFRELNKEEKQSVESQVDRDPKYDSGGSG